MFFKKKPIGVIKLEIKQKKLGELLDDMLKAKVNIYCDPDGDEYFIVDKEKLINVHITSSTIRISNHDYLYEVSYTEKIMREYLNKVRDAAKARNANLKKELFNNALGLIDKLKKMYPI